MSPGCDFCYAEKMSHRNPKVLGVWGDGGTRVIASEAKWKEPLRWDRKAREAGERRRVFCASIADVFEDRPELVEPRIRLRWLMYETPNLDWLLLTKRPDVAARWFADYLMPVNVWLGVSVEDQARRSRIDQIRDVPASLRFLSVEPLLEDLGRIDLTGIGWVIVGGESGPHARPMHPDWARAIRDRCVRARVPYFFKQWGEWCPLSDDTPTGSKLAFVHRRGGVIPAASPYEPGCPCDSSPQEAEMVRVGKKAAGRLLDGVEWSQFPEASRCD